MEVDLVRTKVGSDKQSGRALLTDVVTTADRQNFYLSSGAWDDQTLVEAVSRWAVERGDTVAVIDDVESAGHTYAQLARHANSVAARLREMGVGPGDVVTVQMPNWYETVVVDVAVHLLGAVLNPVLPIYRAHELSNIVRTAGSRVIVSPSVYRRFDHRAMIADICAANPGTAQLVVERGDADTVFAHWPALENPPDPDASAVCELIFSSGTESAPKAIMHTEQTICAGTRMLTSGIGLSEADGVWMPSPIGHSTGLNYGVRVALLNGLTLTLQDRWDPTDAVRLIERAKPTYTVAATTFLTDLLDAGESMGADLTSLRMFSCGGAPVPSAVVGRADEAGITVLRIYGSTEVLGATWNRPDSPLEKRVETEGVPLDGVEIEVRDDDGKVLIGVPGELFVRSPSCCVGFFSDEERTRAAFSVDGWVSSGDIGVIDSDGYFTMVGRKKEIIIRGGLNITPREVEDLIAGMAHIREAVVVGIPDERLGEIGCACIVAEEGHEVTLTDVVSYLRDLGLAPFKLPERVLLMDALPRTPTGKVQKFQLVERVLAEGRGHMQTGGRA
ncbi:AMP-binding protein [Rhodococcus opacus]|nr:AMP-binding protein [Rhodococcus opacus]